VAGADVAARIEWATALVAGKPQEQAAELIYTLVGTSLATQESVPAAFAVLAAVFGNAGPDNAGPSEAGLDGAGPAGPWQACLLAASLGGDCDTIAAMAGAVAGACYGVTAFPPEAIAVIDAQGLGLTALADHLYALRQRSALPGPE
jgi:ADP-ribosylglycohydrolase